MCCICVYSAALHYCLADFFMRGPALVKYIIDSRSFPRHTEVHRGGGEKAKSVELIVNTHNHSGQLAVGDVMLDGAHTW